MTVESIVIQPDEVDHSAHEAAMIAKADKAEAANNPAPQETPEATSEERPEWLPEKFKSAEDLAKAYAELEKKQGETKETPKETPEAEKKADEVKPEITPETPTDKAAEVLKDKGLNFDEFHQQIITDGELSAESYKKLADAGIPKEMVDGYINGQAAIAQTMIASVQAEAGGAESYAAMIEWAAANLTTAEQAAFDKAVTTTDVNQAKLAVAGLNAKYTAAVGESPKLLEGNKVVESTDIYQSNAQVTADMKTQLYKTDPAEQARVQAKLARSPVFQ